MDTKLTRSRSNKMVAGVCGGLAEKFNIDANLLRILFVVAGIFAFQAGTLIYVALWLLLPYEDGGPTGFDSLKDQFGSTSSN